MSGATTDEALGEFWDNHDFTEFDADAPDVTIEVTCSVPIERDLYQAIAAIAQRHGVQVETLVNLWLMDRVKAATHRLP